MSFQEWEKENPAMAGRNCKYAAKSAYKHALNDAIKACKKNKKSTDTNAYWDDFEQGELSAHDEDIKTISRLLEKVDGNKTD